MNDLKNILELNIKSAASLFSNLYAHKNPDQISLESSNPKICDKEIAIYIKSNEFITCCFTHMWLDYAPLYCTLG